MISLVGGYLVIHENGIWAMPHSEETVSMLKDKKCEHLYNKNKIKWRQNADEPDRERCSMKCKENSVNFRVSAECI